MVIGSTLYCHFGDLIFQCDLSSGQWTPFPSLRYRMFGLGQVSGRLVAIGGVAEDGHVTNKTHAFDKDSGEWKASLPPMPHARYAPAVIGYGTALIVCGGRVENQALTAIDVYKSEGSQWFSTVPLPFPWCYMRSAIVGERCYLMGGYTGNVIGDQMRLVLSASLPLLLEATSRTRGQSTGTPTSPTHPAVWTRLPDTPLFHSAAACFGDCLLALGGQSKILGGTTYQSVHVYSPTSSSWIQMLKLPAPLTVSAAVTLPTGELRVIGGRDEEFEPTNVVFKATIKKL